MTCMAAFHVPEMLTMYTPMGSAPSGGVGVNPATQIWSLDATPVETTWIEIAVVEREENAKDAVPDVSAPTGPVGPV